MSKTVLIVDDEAPIREMIAVALEMADYHYLEAADAREAHALIVDRQPDLVLLDWPDGAVPRVRATISGGRVSYDTGLMREAVMA